MMAYTFTTYYWLYVANMTTIDPSFTKDDAISLFGKSMQIGMICALFAMPLFGYINDKSNVDRQLALSYFIRCLASLFFFFNEDPTSPWVWIASVMTIIGANIEGLVSYAFWVKRLPKDIRAILNGYYGSIARTGQLVVSASSYYVIKNYSINGVFLIVAIGDLTVLVAAFFLSGTNVFTNDKVEGKAGKDAQAKKAAEKEDKRAQRAAKREAFD